MMPSSFRAKVLAAVRRIPRGRVATYGDVASLAGRPRAARAVGNVMRTCEDPSVPCHRVIGADGALGGFGRWPQLKRDRLRAEGVTVVERRVKEFRAIRWSGPARGALILAALSLALACGRSAMNQQPAGGNPPPDANTPLPGSLVVELSLADAQSRMQAGTLTARALTQAYLDRIAAIDDDGPRLNAVIALNAGALGDADALDAERKAGRIRGPLHGIPVLIKDNIDMAGMANSAGSLALADHRPQQDAFLVRRLREAGMVILGKTNLSEWANFRSTRSTSGWSSLGGQTKNPYVLDRNPCGSSSGTGAAVAASLAMVGIGTETDGSVICPSAVNGLVGVKPTVGLVSRQGIIPISISQDTAGPMARTVADAAALLSVMAGVDPDDPAGPASAGHAAGNYAADLTPDALRGRRIGVLRQAMGALPALDEATTRAIASLRAAGAEVVDTSIANYGSWDAAELEVLLYEFKDGVNRYLSAARAPVASLDALIAWNLANKTRVMPFFGQEQFERAQARGPLTDATYIKARADAKRLAGADGLLATLARDRLDAVVAPSAPPAWAIDHVLGDPSIPTGYGAAAVAGTPSVTVPMGDVMGLPVGLTFMGAPYSESTLIGLAYAFEQATKARRPPQYIASLEEQ